MTVDNFSGQGGTAIETGPVVEDQRVLDIRAKIAATNLSKKFDHHSKQDQGNIINFISTYLDFFDDPTTDSKDNYSQCLKKILEAKLNVREMAVHLALRVQEQIRKNSPEMNADDH